MPLPIGVLDREPTPPRSLIRPRPPLRRLATRRLRMPCRLRAASPLGRAEEQSLQRRTVAAAAAEPPTVDYGFGPGGAPCPSAGRANTPPRVPRPRPPLAVATASAPATSPAPTVPISSGRDHAEPVGTLLSRFSPSPDVPSATTADMNALGAAVDLQFGDSVARYPHADWARQQQAEPACHASMRYIALGRPPSPPDNFFCVFPFAPAPLLLGDSRVR